MPDAKPNYLDPRVLATIHRLDIRARLVVEGFISGEHRSPYRGFSVEFAEHREYAPGDDLKHVDWKVYSKTDRYYVKQYEEETNLRAHIFVDASESMRYRGQHAALSKYDYAATLAAAMSFLLLQQQDAAGLALFDSELRQFLPPSANPATLQSICHHLEQAQPSRKTNVSEIFHALAEKIRKRGFIVLISDLFVPLDDLFRGLEHFRHRRHEVMLLHVMDDDELRFPFEGNILLRGMEELPSLKVEPRSIRAAYLDAVGNFTAQVKRLAAHHRIDYRLINTKENVGAVLAAFLAGRAATAKLAGTKR
jgi:uncharacterized protein (DUF58 family)